MAPLTTPVVLEVQFTISQDVQNNKFLLKAKTIRNEYIASEVFVFQRDISGNDTFAAIATPIRLDEFPANEPNPGIPYFRLDEVELELTSMLKLNDVLADLKADLQQLVRDQQELLPVLDQTFNVVFGGSL